MARRARRPLANPFRPLALLTLTYEPKRPLTFVERAMLTLRPPRSRGRTCDKVRLFLHYRLAGRYLASIVRDERGRWIAWQDYMKQLAHAQAQVAALYAHLAQGINRCDCQRETSFPPALKAWLCGMTGGELSERDILEITLAHHHGLSRSVLRRRIKEAARILRQPLPA